MPKLGQAKHSRMSRDIGKYYKNDAGYTDGDVEGLKPYAREDSYWVRLFDNHPFIILNSFGKHDPFQLIACM